MRRTKELLGLPPDETFHVDDDVLAWFREAGRRHEAERVAWHERYRSLDASIRDELDAALAGRGLTGWEAKLPKWEAGGSVATRKASGACFQAALDVVPGLLGGGADLTDNTGTALSDTTTLSATERSGRQIHFGIREHAMASLMNGMARHGGVLPVGGTFFVFSDYLRPAMRLAALMRAHVIYSFTHDSVGLGEDGPTHQPIEHLATLRAIPGLLVVRPADANETAQAWQVAVEHDGPVALVLSRQNLPVLTGTDEPGRLARGAYVIDDGAGEDSTVASGQPQVVLIGTGSEVAVCLAAAQTLRAGGVATRVVSMPSWELFAEQDLAYQATVLPGGAPRLSVEAATTFGWQRWADDSIGIDRFGASAPGEEALEKLGINPANVAERARLLVVRHHT